ncbi:General stress protein 26 [Pontiella desulfatans]|uniref:General stress protein 26 n=1 Tax=Pontiella desulfatans TaxID=2750659 RepID=A0A6C2U388_PONDE|nr:pyridoxamine 5'-phosphate oxidase family protein [Pontiella desulfatans]VGO14353.1 General stress protein 26 [Pontiella desulfatans]
MSELKSRITKGLRPLQLASLASITTDGLPWTRYVMIGGDEELVLRCATHLGARKAEQIRQNPEVHLTCGVLSPLDMRPYFQVQGKAEIVTDAATKDAFWNPSLESIFNGADDPNYGVVVIRPYRIELWTPPEMQPEVLEMG